MSRVIDVIGVPCDLGGGKSGARDGPAGLIAEGLLEGLRSDGHRVTYIDLEEVSEFRSAFTSLKSPSGATEYKHELALVFSALYARTFASLRLGHTPLVLGGDHSIAIGSIGAGLNPDILAGKFLGCLWLDAHYDAHTHRTSHSHHANGMPLALLLGKGLPSFKKAIGGRSLHPAHVLHVGAGESDCEPEEIALFKKLHIPNQSMRELNEAGWIPALNALYDLRDRVDRIAVSLDLDVFDKRWCPAVAFQNNSGMHRESGLWFADEIAKTGKVTQVDIVEYNPLREQFDTAGHGETARLAIELAVRLLHQPSGRKSFIAKQG